MNSIKNRRSIRKYTNKSLDKETVLEILNAGRLAPSAKNRQPWYFVVLQNKCKDEVADKMLTYTKVVLGKTEGNLLCFMFVSRKIISLE